MLVSASLCYSAPPVNRTQRKLDAIIANHSTGPRLGNTLLSIVADWHGAHGESCIITSVSVFGPQALLVSFIRDGQPLDAELRAVDRRRVRATMRDTAGNELKTKDDLFNLRDLYAFLAEK